MSFSQVSPPKPYMHLSCLPYVPHALSISFFLIWSATAQSTASMWKVNFDSHRKQQKNFYFLMFESCAQEFYAIIWNKILYIFLTHSAVIFIYIKITILKFYSHSHYIDKQGIRLYLITYLYHDWMFRQLNSRLQLNYRHIKMVIYQPKHVVTVHTSQNVSKLQYMLKVSIFI